MSLPDLFLGIDVGTASARSGIFTNKGELIASVSVPIFIKNPKNDHYEQSSANIWESVCSATKKALELAEKKLSSSQVADSIKGIGFDATCSLVLLGNDLRPIHLSHESDTDVIMWMDHRATKQAEILSSSGHVILETTGGKISPEMSVAKVCWLYQERRKLYDAVAHLIELPDFLVLCATGSLTRSLNSLVCKWGYDSKNGWSDDFWGCIIDHSDLKKLFEKCGGDKVVLCGERVLNGLSERAAFDLGLKMGTCVAGSLIDAYSGVLGSLGLGIDSVTRLEAVINSRMAIIAGTSSCHILVRSDCRKTGGVWGPYTDALLPGKLCMEGGQSLTGKALELILKHHPEWETFSSLYESTFDAIQALNSKVMTRKDFILDTCNLHVLPDLHGNRSPFADPSVRGVIVGLNSDLSRPSLFNLYLATVLALCYGTRQIIESLKVEIQELVVCGGMASNSLFLHLLADITCTRILIPAHDAVLCGSAMLGYAAFHNHPEALLQSMTCMSSLGQKEIEPDLTFAAFHDKKYLVFLELYKDFFKYQQMMM